MFKQVHHLGFAIYNLEKVIGLMDEVYGLECSKRITITDRKMEAVLFKTGETWLEYLSPLSSKSPLNKHLQENGEEFHHIAYKVESIEDTKKPASRDTFSHKKEQC